MRLARCGWGWSEPLVAAAPAGCGLLGRGRGVASAGARAPGPSASAHTSLNTFGAQVPTTAPGEPLPALLPTSPGAAGLRPHLLPLGPAAAPPGVGTARAAASLATASHSFPGPSPALACSVWPAEPRNPVPVPPWPNPFRVTRGLPGYQPLVSAAVRAESRRGGGDGDDVLAAECSPGAGAHVALPRAWVTESWAFGPRWGLSPRGTLQGVGLHTGGLGSVRPEALRAGVSWRLGPGGRGV